MSSAYNTELHKFIEAYFAVIGARIEQKETDYFVVAFTDSHTVRYTYSPRIAAENKEIKLLAKGSKELQSILKNCSSHAALSQVKASYTEESIRHALKPKQCCDLCPFITICEQNSQCCDFCYNYRHCNTCFSNADFMKFSTVTETQAQKLLCFIFTVELSNDYSLSQKIEKTLTVMVDTTTGKVYEQILAADLTHLAITQCDQKMDLSQEDYTKFLRVARQGAEQLMQEQMEVFKREIEKPLVEKITAITTKFEEDYVEKYTKSTLDELEQLQSEGLKLCDREIRGYTINSSYHLNNVILISTPMDTCELLFKRSKTDKILQVPAKILLSRVDIKCSQCGNEIETGALCDEGHVLCSKCSEICSVCGEVICSSCDDEVFVCSTCGEMICSHCLHRCASCEAVVCASHAYSCSTCGESNCIDCYQICDVCGTNICTKDTSTCHRCNEPICAEHVHECSKCSTQLCDNHVDECIICGELLCEEHQFNSAFSHKVICEAHKATCTICNDIFASNEIKTCRICSDSLCPNHTKSCAKCKESYCGSHVNHCKSCGSELCNCSPFMKCKLCHEEYCPDCINPSGYCKACEEMSQLAEDNDLLKQTVTRLPSLEGYKKYYLGVSKEIKVLYARNLLNGHLAILNVMGEIIANRDIGFIEGLLHKNKYKRSER